MELRFEHFNRAKHKDGVYDTCPLHGPKKYMPDRKVAISGWQCWLLTNPEMTWNVNFFFDVNLIVVQQ